MASPLAYGAKLFCNSFLSKLPEEVLYLGNEAHLQITGQDFIHRSFLKTPSEMVLKRLIQVSAISTAFSLLSGNIFQLGSSIGTISVCIAGRIQLKAVRDLTNAVADLKETLKGIRAIKNQLAQTNSDLRKTKTDLEKTNQSLKKTGTGLEKTNKGLEKSKKDLQDEISRLNTIISSMEDITGTLTDLGAELLAKKENLAEVEKKLQHKITLLENISEHINDECSKLTKSREDLSSDLKRQIDDLKEVLRSFKALAKA